MVAADETILEAKHFARLARTYRRDWPVRLVVCDLEGRIIAAQPTGGKAAMTPEAQAALKLATAESLRWGDPSVVAMPPAHLVWAVPIMRNQRVLGGVAAWLAEDRALAGDVDVRWACTALRLLLERDNLTNAAMLASRRDEYFKERSRAETIHALKHDQHYDIRRMYLHEEPALIAAIRRNDRGQAREILNRLLVAMYHRAGDRLDLVKSFFMELVVTMTRTAVEAGGAPAQLLGTNFKSLTELATIDDEEQLSPWLTRMLEALMDSLQTHRHTSDEALVTQALVYMSEHFAQNLTREDVASVVCASPSHFSRLMRKHVGRSFVQVLNQMRVDRAAELLTRTDRSLALIALDTGFRDQSYFTKVFRRYRRLTPREYRLKHGRSR